MTAGRLDPEMPGVNFYLANIYHSLAQDAAAIAALEKERVNSPDSEEVLENLASMPDWLVVVAVLTMDAFLMAMVLAAVGLLSRRRRAP